MGNVLKFCDLLEEWKLATNAKIAPSGQKTGPILVVGL